MHRLWRDAAAEARRLLRVLFLRLRAVPAHPGGALESRRCGILLRGTSDVTGEDAATARDWLRKPHTSLMAWWIPQSAIVASLFAPVSARAAVWIIALIWMGSACILNARRCGRTHCRYTGPYYLAMVVPVALLATGIFSAGFYGWLTLAVVILAGGKIIWWATERAWGRFLDISFDGPGPGGQCK